MSEAIEDDDIETGTPSCVEALWKNLDAGRRRLFSLNVKEQLEAPVKTVFSTRSGHRQGADDTMASLHMIAKSRGIDLRFFDFVYPLDHKPLSWHLTRDEMFDIVQIPLDGTIPERAPGIPLPELSTERWRSELGAIPWDAERVEEILRTDVRYRETKGKGREALRFRRLGSAATALFEFLRGEG